MPAGVEMGEVVDGLAVPTSGYVHVLHVLEGLLPDVLAEGDVQIF